MKGFLTGNLGTKGMALLLAFLTWVYLFTQGTGRMELEVEFRPILDLPDLATARYFTSDRKPLQPGGWMTVAVSGPKADVRSLRIRFHRCEFKINPASLKSDGTHTIRLERKDFVDLPDRLSVEPLPSADITLEYARYVEREIELEAGPEDVEGRPPEGYRVEAVTAVPAKIRAQVPAGVPLARARIRRVPVEGRVDAFILENWSLDPSFDEMHIRPGPFRVEVRVARVPATRRIVADLHVVTRPEHARRVILEDKQITLGLEGPEELVREAEQRPAAFFAYAVVKDGDMDTEGNKNIRDLGCHILEPRFQKIHVVPMADVEKPENRQVKIKVLPK